MTKEMETIGEMIRRGQVDQAIELLQQLPPSHQAYFLLGKAYTKLGDYPRAIYNYTAAQEMNPQSPATEALKQLKEILDFYHTDLYNP